MTDEQAQAYAIQTTIDRTMNIGRDLLKQTGNRRSIAFDLQSIVKKAHDGDLVGADEDLIELMRRVADQ